LSLDAFTDGAVKRSWHVFFDVFELFVLGVDEGVLAVLADKNFVGHGYFL